MTTVYSVCSVCKKQSTKKCNKCNTSYCSKECQEKDWDNHKKVCIEERKNKMKLLKKEKGNVSDEEMKIIDDMFLYSESSLKFNSLKKLCTKKKENIIVELDKELKIHFIKDTNKGNCKWIKNIIERHEKEHKEDEEFPTVAMFNPKGFEKFFIEGNVLFYIVILGKDIHVHKGYLYR